MTRRTFVGCLAAAAPVRLSSAPPVSIEAALLQRQIETLSTFGRPVGGTFQSGVSRVGYSDDDIAGRKYVMDLMRKAGAEVRIDAAGNIFASRPGRDASAPGVLFGSHIDSVPNGGNFDGDLGSLSSIEVLRVLGNAGIEMRRSLTAVIWACEEASFGGTALNGSRLAAGLDGPDELKKVAHGMTKAEAIRRIGGDPDRIETARIANGQYHAYVELHVEQGGTLERDRLPAGVVDGIVSIDDYDVVINGVANHAGTTPMPDRQDALVAASALTLAVREVANSESGAQVGTVGRLDVTPNAVNVIPGEVHMSIEFRDLSSAKLERLGEKIRARAAAIAREMRTQIQITSTAHHEPARAAIEVQRVIESAAGQLRLQTKHLPSGAGHDAQSMARLMPMGMIFVPSVGGISHSPKELTSWQDCANGANILLQTVLQLAA
jgi:N-carbamoyl-L-amino-acid hydrolase